MASRRELPRNFEPEPDDDLSETGPSYIQVGCGSVRPLNEYEALMCARPHEYPVVSREERLPLRDIIADALDELTDEQRWIFDALFVRRLSLRKLGAELSIPKTTVARMRDTLLSALREMLETDPRIQSYLEGT